MNAFLNMVTYPFRAVYDYVDTNPSTGQLRTHVARQDVAIQETEAGVIVALKLEGTDKVSTRVHAAAVHHEDRQSYIAGVKDGVELMKTEVATVTRHEIKAQAKIVNEIRAAHKAEAKARKAQNKAATAADAGTVLAGA